MLKKVSDHLKQGNIPFEAKKEVLRLKGDLRDEKKLNN
jgi:hypothetical protein